MDVGSGVGPLLVLSFNGGEHMSAAPMMVGAETCGLIEYGRAGRDVLVRM